MSKTGRRTIRGARQPLSREAALEIMASAINYCVSAGLGVKVGNTERGFAIVIADAKLVDGRLIPASVPATEVPVSDMPATEVPA